VERGDPRNRNRDLMLVAVKRRTEQAFLALLPGGLPCADLETIRGSALVRVLPPLPMIHADVSDDAIKPR
jgi:hypothetical protein